MVFKPKLPCSPLIPESSASPKVSNVRTNSPIEVAGTPRVTNLDTPNTMSPLFPSTKHPYIVTNSWLTRVRNVVPSTTPISISNDGAGPSTNLVNHNESFVKKCYK